MANFKNLKIVKKIENVSSKLKWILNSQIKDYQLNAKYFDLICNDEPMDIKKANSNLEDMVKAVLKKEFSEDIEKMKSYDFLVNAIVHNIKKKQNDEIDKEENM